jgi:hypothetical protein
MTYVQCTNKKKNPNQQQHGTALLSSFFFSFVEFAMSSGRAYGNPRHGFVFHVKSVVDTTLCDDLAKTMDSRAFIYTRCLGATSTLHLPASSPK